MKITARANRCPRCGGLISGNEAEVYGRCAMCEYEEDQWAGYDAKNQRTFPPGIAALIEHHLKVARGEKV